MISISISISILISCLLFFKSSHSFSIHPTKTISRSKFSFHAIHSSKNDQLDFVQVHVEKRFHGILPKQASDAWMTYQWKNGGGLLGVTILNNKKNRKRRILPIWMEETLLTTDGIMEEEKEYDDDDDDNDIHNNDDPEKENQMEMIQYTVTDMGLFVSEIVEGSHMATVRFTTYIDTDTDTDMDLDTDTDTDTDMDVNVDGVNFSTLMTWDVSFQCKNQNRRSLWQSITDYNIQTVANNLESYLAKPYLYKLITHIQYNPYTNSIKQPHSNWIDLWIDFVWKNGGGLPIPSFLLIPLNDNARMYLPIFLIETLLFHDNHTETSTDTNNQHLSSTSMNELYYQVVNPGLFTYQVHTHLGRVRFHKLDHHDNSKKNTNDTPLEQIQMIWEVEIRPLYGLETFVKLFTAAIISTISRNMKHHIEHPNAIVTIANLTNIDTPLDWIQIPLDTWLGGVIYAYMSDKRTLMERWKSMFQPWTWGRYQDEFEMKKVEEWTRDNLN